MTQPHESAPLHVVFGAGQVGTKVARQLAHDGHRVRLVRRSGAGEPIPGVTWARGDATDPASADEACAGASVVYHSANPATYYNWATLLPPITNGIREAATRAGARLVVLDNLYMVGRPSRSPFTEDEPMKPCSRKGALRAELAQGLLDAHARGDVEVAIGRASDFFGPDTPNTAMFRPAFFASLAQGKAVDALGDPDMPHSYSYTPDVARGLAVLGTREGSTGRVWHLPVAAQLSTRELVERFAEAAGQPAKIRTLPTWLLRALGLFSPLMREVSEMAYQWEVPYLASDEAFRTTFGVDPTPLDEAIAATLRSHGLLAEAEAA
ncbi:MAG: NAD-dependent epimerase/dehydratase family protein [Sandaracinaceae bacterium]